MQQKHIHFDKKTESQIDRFKETARELGCDEGEAAFDEKLKEIAKHKSEEGGRGGLEPPSSPLRKGRSSS